MNKSINYTHIMFYYISITYNHVCIYIYMYVYIHSYIHYIPRLLDQTEVPQTKMVKQMKVIYIYIYMYII